jgi:hypothetical protein
VTEGVQPACRTARGLALHAVAARILPGVHGPGAVRSGAGAGPEKALEHRCFRGLKPLVEGFLDGLDEQANRLHGREFVACTPAQQDELLRAAQQGPSPWSRVLFRSLVEFTLEGLLGDPLHGGNRDFSGWEAAGLRAEDVRAGLCRRAGAA